VPGLTGRYSFNTGPAQIKTAAYRILTHHRLNSPVLIPDCVVLWYFPELPLHPNPVHLQLSLAVHEQAPVRSKQNDFEQRVGDVKECLRFEVPMKSPGLWPCIRVFGRW